MTDERQRRLMQEALDQTASEDMVLRLQRELDEDPQAASEFQRLKRVDDLLHSAPMERAPERLAMHIMARIAAAAKPEALSREGGLALAVGLALVMLVALPLLTAAIGLFLLAASSAEALAALIQQIVGLVATVVAMVEVFVTGAQQTLRDNPQTPAILAGLIPVTLYVLLRFMANQQRAAQERSPGEDG